MTQRVLRPILTCFSASRINCRVGASFLVDGYHFQCSVDRLNRLFLTLCLSTEKNGVRKIRYVREVFVV